MSIWSDLQDRSSGEQVRKEDEHWGVIEITRCTSVGERFEDAYGKRIPGEKIGKLVYFNVNWRVIDSRDIDNKDKKWWYFRDPIVVERKDMWEPRKAKEIFLGYVKEMEKEGKLDPILKDDGQYDLGKRNHQRILKMQQKIKDDSMKIIFGEEGL